MSTLPPSVRAAVAATSSTGVAGGPSSKTRLRRPSLPPMPDLSHLTEEERKIIESVINRQREEEEKEAEILRSDRAAVSSSALLLQVAAR